MPHITTHVLDTSAGRPAAGMNVRLELVEAGGMRPVAAARTDQDGRVRDWLPDGVPAGHYQVVFETGSWFRAAGRETLYPEIAVHVEVRAGEPHYHVPLLLSPFGYSTYRGS
jgi:5-hydroxyisourate hydrolase